MHSTNPFKIPDPIKKKFEVVIPLHVCTHRTTPLALRNTINTFFTKNFKDGWCYSVDSGKVDFHNLCSEDEECVSFTTSLLQSFSYLFWTLLKSHDDADDEKSKSISVLVWCRYRAYNSSAQATIYKIKLQAPTSNNSDDDLDIINVFVLLSSWITL